MRTIIDIVTDYVKWLQNHNVTLDLNEILLNETLLMEVYSALLEKCYDEQLGFFYFTEFIIGSDEFTNRHIWNPLVKFFYDKIQKHKNINIMAPRGHGKSYFFSILYPLYVMFLFKGVDILLVNNTATQVKINFDKLKSIINDNEVLLKWKPRDGEWSAEAIEYHNGKIYVRTLGSQSKGLHVNFLIIDDILRQDSRYSFKYINDYVMQTLFPTVQRKMGRTILVGTPQTYLDIHHYIAEIKENSGRYAWEKEMEDDYFAKGLVFGGPSYRGFFNYQLKAKNEDETALLLPDIFTLNKLRQIEETMGGLNFQKEYLCMCISDRTALFPELLLQHALDKDEAMHLSGEVAAEYIVSADVATSGAASADSSGFIVIQYANNGEKIKKTVRHIVKVKGMPVEEQIDTLERLSKNFNDAIIQVEKNNVGVALIQALEYRGRTVITFVTNKPKKEGAIRFLISEMSSGNLCISYSKESMEFVNPLLDELRGFGTKVKIRDGRKIESMEAITGHDDLVDALWLGNLAATDAGESGESYAIVQN